MRLFEPLQKEIKARADKVPLFNVSPQERALFSSENSKKTVSFSSNDTNKFMASLFRDIQPNSTEEELRFYLEVYAPLCINRNRIHYSYNSSSSPSAPPDSQHPFPSNLSLEKDSLSLQSEQSHSLLLPSSLPQSSNDSSSSSSFSPSSLFPSSSDTVLSEEEVDMKLCDVFDNVLRVCATEDNKLCCAALNVMISLLDDNKPAIEV